MSDNCYDLDLEELSLPKPYTAEQRAEINELYAQMAADLAEINGYDKE